MRNVLVEWRSRLLAKLVIAIQPHQAPVMRRFTARIRLARDEASVVEQQVGAEGRIADSRPMGTYWGIRGRPSR